MFKALAGKRHYHPRPRRFVMKSPLTIERLCSAANGFAEAQSHFDEPKLYGVTDGKAVGTYLEAKFIESLAERYSFQTGSAAKGIDLPELQVDIKLNFCPFSMPRKPLFSQAFPTSHRGFENPCGRRSVAKLGIAHSSSGLLCFRLPEKGKSRVKTTSIKQPQSSSPFASARQKVFGLGYALLVFVYEKRDNKARSSARLVIRHVVFVQKERTADYQTSRGVLQILDNDGNEDGLVAFMQDKMLPADEIELFRIARDVLKRRPVQGYLTISNALQWRLQYKRVIDNAGTVEGVLRVR